MIDASLSDLLPPTVQIHYHQSPPPSTVLSTVGVARVVAPPRCSKALIGPGDIEGPFP